MEWDEWGNCLLDTNPGFQPFGFAGSLYDADLRLHHLGARECDPTVGRWLQPDPIGLEGGLNLYEYSANDPVNYIDPAGLDPYSALERAAINGYNNGGFWGGLQANLALLGTTGLDVLGGRGVAASAAASGEASGKGQIGRAIGYGGLTIAQMGLSAWGTGGLAGSIGKAGAAGREAIDVVVDDSAAYAKYWENLAGRAPRQSSPYNVINKYSKTGELRGATTYDAYGNRAYQYELGPSATHGEGYHIYDNASNGALGDGARSAHILF